MFIDNNGLKEIESFAEENHNAKVLLMVQILREVRELKKLLEQHNAARDSSYDRSGSSNNSDN